MAWAQETGVDFFRRITAEVKVVQDDVGDLQRLAADLRSSILSESRIRDNELTKVHDRISQERAAETQIRATLEARLDVFETKTNNRVGALGKDCVATKDQLTVLEGTVKEHAQKAAMQVDADNTRFKELEQLMPTKAPLLHLQKLEADVALLKTEVERDFSTTTQSIRTVTAAAAQDFKVAQDGMKRAQAYSEAAKQMLASELQAHQARTLADRESLIMHVDAVEKVLEKHSRQQDADRDRASTAILAVEREMSTKALKAETDLIGPNTLRAAHDVVESRAQRLEQHITAARQEQVPYRHRLEALEVALPTKADAVEIPRLTLAISDSNARHEAAYKRAQEHGMRLDKFHSHINNHVVKLEGLESRGNVLDAKVSTKAEVTDHFTKDNVVELLKDFYRREEVDAMMSRVWWRVGDVTKGCVTTAPGASPRRAVR